MKRRNLIFSLLAVAAMSTARAQQTGKVYRIAVVHPSHPVAALGETSFCHFHRTPSLGIRRGKEYPN